MKIYNRRARHDYELFESLEAGLSLTGAEVKQIKQGKMDLASSFVRIKDGEAWLVGTNIPVYGGAAPEGYDPLRTRKVLLHKAQILSLATKSRAQGLTLVPLAVYTKGHLVKLQIALGKGKKRYEKREAKRRRDLNIEAEQALRRKY